MAEPDPVAEIAELDQAGLFQYRRRGGADTELPGSPPKQRRVAEGLGAGQEQQSAGVEGQVLRAAPKALLDGRWQSACAGQSEPCRELAGREPLR